MKEVKKLLAIAEITHGRINNQRVFSDFIGLCACFISNQFDPVHSNTRSGSFTQIASQYTKEELMQMRKHMGELAQILKSFYSKGKLENILVQASLELGIMGHSEEPTPMNVARLMAELSFGNDLSNPESKLNKEIKENGYFTVLDTAAGGGTLLLGAAEIINDTGINYFEKMACLAV